MGEWRRGAANRGYHLDASLRGDAGMNGNTVKMFLVCNAITTLSFIAEVSL